MNSPAVLLDHYRTLSCARQWRGFVRAFAGELAGALPPAECARVMGRIGERFATSHPLPACDDLAALQRACNQVWQYSDWGVAEFREGPVEVTIAHIGDPLVALLGADAAWSTGFLEGAYRGWFRAAGMLPALDVHHCPGISADVTLFSVRRIA